MKIVDRTKYTTIVPLKPGVAGVGQTIAVMRRLARRDMSDPAVKRIVNSCKKSRDLATVECIYNWVINNVTYKSDPKRIELVIAPKRVIEEFHDGDCDDMATLLACLLKSAGYDVAFKTIAWRVQDYTHVYLIVFIPSLDGWIPLDPVLRTQGFGREHGKIIKRRHWPA